MAERLPSYPPDSGDNGVRNSHAMPLTLSVVLPNYNHAKFIGRALAALLNYPTTELQQAVPEIAASPPVTCALARPAIARWAAGMLEKWALSYSRVGIRFARRYAPFGGARN